MSRAESTVTPPAGGTESAKLHRRALGVPDLMFFIIAASAPLTAVAGGQAATYLVTGNRAVAFMFIPLGIVLALFTVGYFRRRPQESVGSWAATLAPALAGILLLLLLVLGVANFNVLITGLTNAPIDTMTVVLPVILFGGGIVGLIVGAVLKRNRPEVYERIGGGAGAEE